MVFLALTEGLGIDENLVFFVHRGHSVIALDRAFAGGHLADLFRVKNRQVQLVLNQVVNRVIEGAGLELLSVVDDHHRILVVVVVVVLKTRHSDGSLSVFSILPKTVRFGVFLQP